MFAMTCRSTPSRRAAPFSGNASSSAWWRVCTSWMSSACVARNPDGVVRVASRRRDADAAADGELSQGVVFAQVDKGTAGPAHRPPRATVLPVLRNDHSRDRFEGLKAEVACGRIGEYGATSLIRAGYRRLTNPRVASFVALGVDSPARFTGGATDGKDSGKDQGSEEVHSFRP